MPHTKSELHLAYMDSSLSAAPPHRQSGFEFFHCSTLGGDLRAGAALAQSAQSTAPPWVKASIAGCSKFASTVLDLSRGVSLAGLAYIAAVANMPSTLFENSLCLRGPGTAASDCSSTIGKILRVSPCFLLAGAQNCTSARPLGLVREVMDYGRKFSQRRVVPVTFVPAKLLFGLCSVDGMKLQPEPAKLVGPLFSPTSDHRHVPPACSSAPPLPQLMRLSSIIMPEQEPRSVLRPALCTCGFTATFHFSMQFFFRLFPPRSSPG